MEKLQYYSINHRKEKQNQITRYKHSDVTHTFQLKSTTEITLSP